MNLPIPDNYQSWQAWARALLTALAVQDAPVGGKAVMGATAAEINADTVTPVNNETNDAQVGS